MFTVKEEYKESESEVGNEILKYPAALSISYTSSLEAQLHRMLGALDTVIIVLIISAGMLAFVVLYNLNNVNITERQRELATLKVLGFYDTEVSAYVYRENVILTFIGVLAGAVFGIIFAQVYYPYCGSGCSHVRKKYQSCQFPVLRTADNWILHDRKSVYASEIKED